MFLLSWLNKAIVKMNVCQKVWKVSCMQRHRLLLVMCLFKLSAAAFRVVLCCLDSGSGVTPIWHNTNTPVLWENQKYSCSGWCPSCPADTLLKWLCLTHWCTPGQWRKCSESVTISTKGGLSDMPYLSRGHYKCCKCRTDNMLCTQRALAGEATNVTTLSVHSREASCALTALVTHALCVCWPV